MPVDSWEAGVPVAKNTKSFRHIKNAARRNECCNGLLFPPEQFQSYRTFSTLQDLFSVFFVTAGQLAGQQFTKLGEFLVS